MRSICISLLILVASSAEEECSGAVIPNAPPGVGSKKLHEDDRSVVWDLRIPAGVRMAPHEHMYDYSYHVISGSTLAVFSGEDGSHMFSFDPAEGQTLAFKRNGTKMVDIEGNIPPFDAIHGVENVGPTEYREILIETKPCALDQDFLSAPVRRIRMMEGEVKKQKAAAFGAFVGKMANHESEVAFARGFTAAIVATFKSGAARDDAGFASHAALLVKGDAKLTPLEFDYHPIVVLGAPVPQAGMLRHVLLCTFKLDAPVGALVAEYSALPKLIPEMKSFEWGPVAMPLGRESEAQGFEFAFMTGFDNAKDRDVYLTHPDHAVFATKIFAHIAEIVVMDFHS